MNVNHEHKVIWWAPERCGTKALAHVFSKLGFEFYVNGVKSNYQSHEIKIPDELSDYKIIFSVRNPYDRVLSLFTNFTNVGKNSLYMKGNENVFVQKYEIFLNELFSNTNKQVEKPILMHCMVSDFARAMPDDLKYNDTIDTITAYQKYVASKPWVSNNYLRMPTRKPEWI